jgi:acetyl esterase/lipase
MRRYIIAFGILFLLNESSFAQTKKRFQSEVFAGADSVLNIQYGEAINHKNIAEKLLLDFYSPAIKDTLAKRPLMIFIHGGGFQDGKKNGGFVNLISNSLAKRGYTFASIDYRLGINAPKSNQDYFEALLWLN